jgi:hypothetical protein
VSGLCRRREPRVHDAAAWCYARAPVKDVILMAGLVLGLATLITVHIGISLRLLVRERPRWRGPVALVVPPLAVIWGFKAGWNGLASLWLGSLAVYVAALVTASALG